MLDQELPSAMDHEWREVIVHVYPTSAGARFVVLLQRNKGTRRQWQRHLCTVTTPALDASECETFVGILKVVSRCLADAAERTERS
jgi:hypothetical protein